MAGARSLPATEDGAPLLGIVLLIGGVCLFAVTDAAGKLLSETISVGQIVWARYLFALPVILATMPWSARHAVLRVERPLLQIGRALMPIIASFAVVTGLSLLPIAEVTALTFASPLLVVALTGPLLGERASLHDWIGVVIGFIGILVIVRPGSDAFAWASLFPLGCAFTFALFQLATRIVGRRDDPSATLVWTIMTGLVVTTPLLLLDWQPVTGQGWALMAVSGLGFGGAQYLLIRAFRLAPASLLTPFTYCQIVPATLLGLVLFGTLPDLWGAVGTAIVIGAGLLVLTRARAGRA